MQADIPKFSAGQETQKRSNFSPKVEKRRRFMKAKVNHILWLKRKQWKDIDIPNDTLSRVFEKDTIILKRRFKVSNKVKNLSQLERLFSDRKILLENWEKNDKILHELEVLFYIFKTFEPDFLEHQWIDENWIQQKYGEILIPAIQLRVREFDERGNFTPQRKQWNVGQIDPKKMRKIFTFRKILHSKGYTDKDINISDEKYREIAWAINYKYTPKD